MSTQMTLNRFVLIILIAMKNIYGKFIYKNHKKIYFLFSNFPLIKHFFRLLKFWTVVTVNTYCVNYCFRIDLVNVIICVVCHSL